MGTIILAGFIIKVLVSCYSMSVTRKKSRVLEASGMHVLIFHVVVFLFMVDS